MTIRIEEADADAIAILQANGYRAIGRVINGVTCIVLERRQ